MAVAAGGFVVRALQFELGFAVVKFAVPETGSDVTLIACIVWIPFCGNLPFVRVFVAIHTAFADLPEFPFVFGRRGAGNIPLFQMAGKTRCRNVRSIERILRFCVVFEGKNAAQKPICRMAYHAVRTDVIDGKLLIVIILVAIGAFLERHRVGHLFGDVTLFAVYRDVLALERESRFVVVEFVQIPCFSPAAFIVTINTFPTEFPFVRVFVAGLAIIGENP